MTDTAACNRAPAGRRSPSRRVWLAAALLVVAGCAEEPELRLADGSGTSWSAWEGQWLLINYWAEWCAPCRKEIPELNRIHEDQTGVVVLGVNFDGLQGEPLTALMGEMDVRFPVLLTDPAPRWEQPRPAVLPSTLVIDPEGNLHDVLVGPQTYEDLARAVGMTSEV
ncbi:MAG: TlpA disulfide reductase family protein [Pseudomonadales bacterium]